MFLILNRRSFRASNADLAERARAIVPERGGEVIEASDPAQLAAALDCIVAAGPAKIAVLAGDGTVHAIADHLARLPEHLCQPELMVLAGGRTNLIAGDLGGKGQILCKLAMLLDQPAGVTALPIQKRHTLVIEQHPAPPRHGFFVAGAAVDSAIRACHRYREAGHTFLHKGHLSNPWCLAKLALARLRGRSSLPAAPILEVRAPGLGHLRASVSLFAASSLGHEGLLKPFAPRGTGNLKVTVVARWANRLWWNLPGMLLGRFTPRMNLAQGYLSGRCDRLEILGMARYTIDGEEFESDPLRPMVIRSGPALRFIVP